MRKEVCMFSKMGNFCFITKLQTTKNQARKVSKWKTFLSACPFCLAKVRQIILAEKWFYRKFFRVFQSCNFMRKNFQDKAGNFYCVPASFYLLPENLYSKLLNAYSKLWNIYSKLLNTYSKPLNKHYLRQNVIYKGDRENYKAGRKKYKRKKTSVENGLI